MHHIIQRLIRSPERYQKESVWVNIDTETGEIIDDDDGHGYENQYRAKKGYFYHHLRHSQSRTWWQQYPHFYQACLKLNQEIPDEFNFKMFWKIINSVNDIKPPIDESNWNDIFSYIKQQSC